jgi:DNA polymerase I-like protein with 3'-5' exonuclease and polymerase domains
MKELDFHLLIQVHDEVIGECPRENAKEAAERLSYLMRTAPTELIDLPFKCDCSCTTNWYGEEIGL